MSNINEGIRALSNDEIAAVAGGVLAVSSPRLDNLRALDAILDRSRCPTARLLDFVIDLTILSLRPRIL
jgi:hypothetical protein